MIGKLHVYRIGIFGAGQIGLAIREMLEENNSQNILVGSITTYDKFASDSSIVELDILTDKEGLEKAVNDNDIFISALPYDATGLLANAVINAGNRIYLDLTEDVSVARRLLSANAYPENSLTQSIMVPHCGLAAMKQGLLDALWEDRLLDRAVMFAEGTGSVFDISRAGDWRRMVEARVPFHVDVGMADDSHEQRPDLRSASDHLGNIRQVLSPAIADLATVFGVSRQAIYKWIGGEATPEPDKFERIRALSHAADAFRDAGITRASSMLKMKAFEGRSLMDLAAAGQLLPSHIQSLIAEAQAMDGAYDRSGLAKSKAKPSDDWRTEVSIPGSPER